MFFRRTQNGAFCCSPAEFTKCKFISLSGMFNEMKLISPCCLTYFVIT